MIYEPITQTKVRGSGTAITCVMKESPKPYLSPPWMGPAHRNASLPSHTRASISTHMFCTNLSS